jgi:hypothetical protein
MIFKIPVGNLSKSDAEKYIKQLISSYAYPLGFTRIIKIKKILDKC